MRNEQASLDERVTRALAGFDRTTGWCAPVERHLDRHSFDSNCRLEGADILTVAGIFAGASTDQLESYCERRVAERWRPSIACVLATVSFCCVLYALMLGALLIAGIGAGAQIAALLLIDDDCPYFELAQEELERRLG